MGKILGIPARIVMSRFADRETCEKIESEGPSVTVTVIAGSYDDAVATADAVSKEAETGLLIQDNAFEGYEQVPVWIVEGYSTLLLETEQQLEAQGLKATMIITPIGVGSLGHAVVAHCKSNGRQIRVMTVEPETAACLHHNLKAGEWKTINTSATIMNGMNCGTVSPISWPILSKGVDTSITVSDLECHAAVQYLHEQNINAGPCGAGPLAALKKAASLGSMAAGLGSDAVVILLSTEGARSYKIPPTST